MPPQSTHELTKDDPPPTPHPAAMLIYAVLQRCETRQVRRAAAMGRLDTRVGAALL